VRDEAARKRLRILDIAAGLAVRTHAPLADNEYSASFHQSGSSTGLTAVCRADGTVLSTTAEVKGEVRDLLQGPFSGQACGLNFETGPVDSGVTFQPSTPCTSCQIIAGGRVVGLHAKPAIYLFPAV
jgi:hypothetical protein